MPVAVLVCCMLWANQKKGTQRKKHNPRKPDDNFRRKNITARRIALSLRAQANDRFPRSTRANPFPKVTGLICRLPLPALIILSRGCSPWGPDAVMGTSRRGFIQATKLRNHPTTSPPQQKVFQGLSVAIWTPENPRRFARPRVFLPTSGFHTARWTVKQKRKLCPELPPTSPSQMGVTASTSVCRNVNLLPFRR